MSTAKGRQGYIEPPLKGGEGPSGDGFGNEIERMLMDRPMTRQSINGVPAPVSSGGPANTLDELMAELGMLRGERAELAMTDRQLGRNGTRNGARMSAAGEQSLMAVGADGLLRPSTPRSSAAAVAASGPGLVLPPAKGAQPVTGAAAAVSPAGPLGRSQSPMSTRRSVTGTVSTPPLVTASSPVGISPLATPPPGVLERQAQLETRLEKMEIREQQLMGLVSQLQQQVSVLSRAQQSTQQQLAIVAAAPPSPPPATPPASVTPSTPTTPVEARLASPSRATAAASHATPAPALVAATGVSGVSDEDFIQNDDGESPAGSPRHRGTAGTGPQPSQQQQQLLQQHSQRQTAPTAPAAGAPGGGNVGRTNKLVPPPTVPPEWEVDVSQLRKELGALAANVVRLRDQLATLVPGGSSALSEEVSAQAAAASQLKHNLTQIAMDVVSLHKGLTSLKHNTERSQSTLEKSINDVQLQIQTNALNMLASGPAPGTSGGMGNGHPNAVAAALAASGGLSGSLEESLRSAFARPAMRSLPAFNTADIGFVPDNAGAMAAVSAFGSGGGGRKEHVPSNGGGGGGGLGAALALLNSFEEQAAAEQAEQQKAAVIARQAVSIVDAKVKQVIVHVDRHMQTISSDVEERLRMYEQTIIRMAQQIDRVQRVLKDIEGAAVSRIVVRQGGKEVDEDAAGGEGATRREIQSEEAAPVVKENWVKTAAMANGRFVPQKEERKTVVKPTHGYFRTPA